MNAFSRDSATYHCSLVKTEVVKVDKVAKAEVAKAAKAEVAKAEVAACLPPRLKILT